MIFIIAEKKSIADSIKEALDNNNNYLVGHASGHLFTINTDAITDNTWTFETLPYLPKNFPLLITRPKLLREIQNITSQSITKIINFCDAAQEGELIFRYIAKHLNFPEEKIFRAWPKALTKKAIIDAIENSVPQSEYQSLYHSALARAHSDWKFGINMTRACSIHFKSKYIIGRVKTPILYIVYQRFMSNKNHVVQTHYEIKADNKIIDISANSITQFKSKSEAQSICNQLDALTVKEIKRNEKKRPLPKPYNLNDLQIDSFKYFKLSPEETLSIVQELYEAKYLSYPRTDSNYFTETQKQEIQQILKEYSQDLDISNNPKMFDDSKVSDHYALYNLSSSVPYDSDDIKYKIFHLVKLRILSSFSVPYVYDSYNIILESADQYKLSFKAQEINTKTKGFFEIIYNYPNIQLTHDTSFKSFDITKVQIGRDYKFFYSTIKKDSKPKPLHSYSSLLKILENIHNFYKEEELELTQDELKAIKDAKGIGTPATRGSIIKELIEKSFIEEKSNKLVPSKQGISLINNIKNLSICSPSISASLEAKLLSIRSEDISYSEYTTSFDNDIVSYIEQIKSAPIIEKYNDRVELEYTCPKCNNKPIPLKYNYKCECGSINIPRELCKKKISPKLALQILEKESPQLNFVGKKGKFKAKIKYDINLKKVQFIFK